MRPPPNLTAAQVETIADGFAHAGYRKGLERFADTADPRLSARTRRLAIESYLARAEPTAGESLALALWEGWTVQMDAVPGPLLEALVASGLLLSVDEKQFESPIKASSFGDLILLADRSSPAETTVMPPSPATGLLARLMPSDLRGRRVVELCCGPAPLGLTAARRGAHVVATDVNERCGDFARTNALLNGLQLDVRIGDLFEPIAGEQFDVIVAQPPYIEKPDDVDTITFMHGGPTGEALPMRLFAGIPTALAPGGEAIIAFQAYGETDEIGAKVQAALNTPMQVTVFCAPASPALTRAAELALLHDPDEGEVYEAALRRYLRHLESIDGEPKGVIARIRRPLDGEPDWSMVLDATDAAISRTFFESSERAAFLLAGAETQLLSAVLRFPPGTRLAAEQMLETGEVTHHFHFPEGWFALDRDVPVEWLRLVEAFARGATVTHAISELAQGRGVQAASVTDEALQFVRELLITGALIVAT